METKSTLHFASRAKKVRRALPFHSLPFPSLPFPSCLSMPLISPLPAEPPLCAKQAPALPFAPAERRSAPLREARRSAGDSSTWQVHNTVRVNKLNESASMLTSYKREIAYDMRATDSTQHAT